MPYLRPRATTLPASQSSSRRLPPWKSVASHAFILGGKPATERPSSVGKSRRDSTPAAQPTAIVSCISLKKKAPHVRVVADNTERLARARRDPGGAREHHELLPDFEKHVTRRRYVDAGRLHLLHV